MNLDQTLQLLPAGWRFHLGHTPHWYRRDELPKHLKKRPFEAYVCNGEPIGTKLYVFESADGSSAIDALNSALEKGIAKQAELLSLVSPSERGQP